MKVTMPCVATIVGLISLVSAVGAGRMIAMAHQEDPWVGAGKGFLWWSLCVTLMIAVSYASDWVRGRNMDSEGRNHREP